MYLQIYFGKGFAPALINPKIMSLLTIIILLVVVGFLLWLINKLIPMQPTIKTILNVVVILILVVFLLKALGVWDHLSSVRI